MRNIPKHPYASPYFKNPSQIRVRSCGNTRVICKLQLLGLGPAEHCPPGGMGKCLRRSVPRPASIFLSPANYPLTLREGTFPALYVILVVTPVKSTVPRDSSQRHRDGHWRGSRPSGCSLSRHHRSFPQQRACLQF